MNFSNIKNLTIPEGSVAALSVNGIQLWAVGSDKVILVVEKITSDTYAAETTYTGESFILLDIYPKNASSSVKVTYGGLTKNLTFSGTNSQQVFFGTFNGVTDEIETPTSGMLVIEGGCDSFTCGVYQKGSKATNKGYCSCITDIVEWGNITSIPDYAFYECENITLSPLHGGITSIGAYAFYRCFNINITSIPNGVISIGDSAFEMTTRVVTGGVDSKVKMTEITIPATVTSIGAKAFSSSTSDTGMANEGYLQKITMLGTTPPTIIGTGREQSFGGRGYGTIYVPKGCGDIYKTSDGWTYYANSIVEVS
jgi:hypothetical protein